MIVKGKEILYNEWHSFLNTYDFVGILKVRDINTNKVKTLVGICKQGTPPLESIEHILDYGSKVNLKELSK